MDNERNRRPREEKAKTYRRFSDETEEYEEYDEDETNEEEEQISRLGEFFRNNRMIVILCACAAVLVILTGIAIGLTMLSSGHSDNGLILENITIAGVNVGGMSKTDAMNAVHLATDERYARQTMVVQVLDSVVQISPSVSRISLNVTGAVEAAYAYGRTGTKRQQNQEQYTAMTTGYTVDLAKYLQMDTGAVRTALNELGAKYSTTLSQTVYEITGTMPSLVPDEVSSSGQVLVITKGTPEYALDMDALYDQVLAAYCDDRFFVEADCEFIEPEPLDLGTIYDETYIAPVDASLNTQTYEVTEGNCGYGFDLEAAKARFAELPYGEKLEIAFTRIMPEITAESISSTMFRDILSFYTTNPSGNTGTYRTLETICEKINGVILNPGSVFSYNQTVGNVDVEELYDVSSALYYCVLMADLDVVVRSSSTYYTATHLEPGMDAAVDNASLDFRFRNNTNYPLLIEAFVNGGSVTVSLVGTDEKDYYVRVEHIVTRTDRYTTITQVFTPDNPDGYTDGQVIVTPYTGYTVDTYRYKYSKQSNALISRALECTTVYQRRDGVVCKIQEPETEPPTEPSTPETEGSDPAIEPT